MSNFRNSTVPEWPASENNGYFRSRNTAANDEQRVQTSGSSDNFPRVLNLKPKHVMYLPNDLNKATSELKSRRIWRSVKNAYFWQLVGFLVMFSVSYPVEKDGKPLPWGTQFLAEVCRVCFAAIICYQGLFFIFTLYLTVSMFSVLLTSSADKYGITIHEQIKRYTAFRFLLKPLVLLMLIYMDCLYFQELFDINYWNLLRSTTSSSGCGFLKEACFVLENALVLRISILCAALDFFIRTYLSGQFTLKFPSVPVKRYVGALFNFREIVVSARISVVLSLAVWSACLLFGPLIYSTFFYVFGIKLWIDKFMDRLFLFLNIGFLTRLFVYTFLTRTLLPILLKVSNFHLADFVYFPIEKSAGHEQNMLLHEAMKSDSGYLKLLAFHEYSIKADNGNSDASVFFNVTHPGNHPLNWRNVFGASVVVVKGVNLKVVNFLKSAKIPPNFLQSGLGPYILNMLRERQTVAQQASVPSDRTEMPRRTSMRDLTSSNQPDLRNEIPTITEAIRQNLELLWNDLKTAVAGFFSMQTLNNLMIGGRLDTTIQQNVIANTLSDHLLSFWAITGTMKFLCISVQADTRGIVNQDIKPFLTLLLETYDVFTALEIYISKSIDLEPAVNRKVLEQNREVAAKMSSTCVFAIAKLHDIFQNCYTILGIEDDLKSRIFEVVTTRS